MAWPLMGWWPNRRNTGVGTCAGGWAATLPSADESTVRPGWEGALGQDQRVGDPIWGQRGGVAHRSSALHDGADQSARNDGEGGRSVVRVDNSRFGNVTQAQEDYKVVAVWVGRGPRRLPLVVPPRRMERLVSGSWPLVTLGGLQPGGSW
jgi:hypothetical protein